MKLKTDPLMPIGKVAARTGVAVSKIRYYETEGLIFSVRSSSGQRLFKRSTIRRVSFILISQQLGYSLNDIRILLKSLPSARTPMKADWDRLASRMKTDLNARISQLEQLRDTLNGCIGCGCLSLQSCGLYNPQDAASRFGSGPRYLLGNSSADVK